MNNVTPKLVNNIGSVFMLSGGDRFSQKLWPEGKYLVEIITEIAVHIKDKHR